MNKPKPTPWEKTKSFCVPILFALRPPHGFRIFVVVAWWVVIGLGVLTILRLYGFQPWSIEDVAGVVTAWPSAIGLTLILILLLLLRPIAGLIDRTSRVEGEGYRWSWIIDPRDKVVIPAKTVEVPRIESTEEVIPPMVITRTEEATAEVKVEETVDAKGEEEVGAELKVEAKKTVEVKVEEKQGIEAGMIKPGRRKSARRGVRRTPLTQRMFPHLTEHDPAYMPYEEGQRMIEELAHKGRVILRQLLSDRLACIYEMRKFTQEEVTHAYSILEKNRVHTPEFIESLTSDKTAADVMDFLLSEHTGRPRNNALDPVSFCSWGALLHQKDNDPSLIRRIDEEVAEAVRKGILKKEKSP